MLERCYEFGPFRLETRGRVLSRHGRPVPLAPKIAETLLLLVQSAGEVVDKKELLEKLWPETFVEEGSLARNISVLRKALQEESHGHEYITTVSKRGYRFSFPVSASSIPAFAVVPPKVMLAVLPFQDLSGEKDQEYFSDGLTEELITQIGRLNPEQLGVIARTSAMQYKDGRKTIQQVGRELNVTYILEGSVRRQGSRVRIAAQLIEVGAQTHVWAESYDENLSDILKVQIDVAEKVARQIKIKLEPLALRTVHIDPRAYEHYLKGRWFWNKRTSEGLWRAVEECQQAIAIDPSSALAYSALADCFVVLGSFPLLEPVLAAPRARDALLNALSIDPTLAEAHAALGFVLSLFEHRWSDAEREFHTALRLNRNYATAHHWFSFYLAAMQRLDEALEQIRQAQRLDPLSRIIHTNIGTVFFWSRQYDSAVDEYKRVLYLDPNFWPAHWMLGLAHEQQGSFESAIEDLQNAIERFPGQSPLLMASLARAYAMSGNCKGAHDLLDRILRLDKDICRSFFHVAVAHAALGELDQTLAALQQACSSQEIWVSFLSVDPRLDSLRSDERFAKLVREAALA